jgi:hypothetical protein
MGRALAGRVVGRGTYVRTQTWSFIFAKYSCLNLHLYFLVCHEILSTLRKANTGISGATISSTVFKIYVALVASAGCFVSTHSFIYHVTFYLFKNKFMY